MTEIEIRGNVDRKKFKELLAFCNQNAEFIDNYKRLSVDLSPNFDIKLRTWSQSSTFDLRIKKSDKEEKISLKIGEFHLKERKEIDIKLIEGGFFSTLKMFETLGFDKGMVYFWESWEFSYKGFEIKLSKYAEDYYVWEIESKNSSTDLAGLTLELNLQSYSKTEYREAIDWENQNIHRLYSKSIVEELLKEFG